MFRHFCLTVLLVIASGKLSSTQSTVATTIAATTTTATTTTTTTATTTTTTTTAPITTTTTAAANTTTLAPTPANTTTLAPTPANTTTLAPTPANTTTLAPTPANTTTPAANTTTPAPTNATTTAPPLPNPKTGNYTLKPNVNATACILARMGLQISFKQGADAQSFNLDPAVTNVSGSCGSNGSDSILILQSDTIYMDFGFSNVSNRFRLHSLNVNVTASGVKFTVTNSSLSLWEASVGSSYMCKKEQSDEITSSVTLHTFDLQIQPFGVEDDKFSTAHECAMDDSSILIPIIVGAALAGLILIVVIAYMIGRRKTYVGYQTL
ncbi:lysosome-associated membrane glycoprotein 2 isoform X2 [Alosa sapidissima]|uniref:lysosome-associated membrane glycoprotein 2 isoform X2 n=1 Tax=Alosa sapidissima TaxID=34773 RepID=UPI001C087206|nr:lysosome-associated membrane glycoprotein 2 isoform X2 [Alosa sapidissima]